MPFLDVEPNRVERLAGVRAQRVPRPEDHTRYAVFGRVISGMEVLDSLYSGYGERSGSGVRQRRQGKIVTGGNAYLDSEFPRLDHLIRVEIIEEPAGG